MPLTGNNRLPNPDLAWTQTLGSNSGQVDPSFAMRLSSNPPNGTPIPLDQALNIPADGLVSRESITVPGFAISQNTKIPSVHNWNLTISRELTRNTLLEVAYTGSRGMNLFTPSLNINPRSFSYVEAVQGANLSTETSVADPLGRT